jgi:hypothetical protein
MDCRRHVLGIFRLRLASGRRESRRPLLPLLPPNSLTGCLCSLAAQTSSPVHHHGTASLGQARDGQRASTSAIRRRRHRSPPQGDVGAVGRHHLHGASRVTVRPAADTHQPLHAAYRQQGGCAASSCTPFPSPVRSLSARSIRTQALSHVRDWSCHGLLAALPAFRFSYNTPDAFSARSRCLPLSRTHLLTAQLPAVV